jgi:hypothetical protein
VSVFPKATWEEEQKSHQKELDELQARVTDLKVRSPLTKFVADKPVSASSAQ